MVRAARRGTTRAPFASAAAACSASRTRPASRADPARIARKKSRYGCWLGCANRRSNGWTRIAGAAVDDRKRVAPEPERQPEPEVRGEQRVRPLARQVRRRARDPEAERVERLAQRPRALLGPAQQRLGVRDRRGPRERGRDPARGRDRPQHPPAHRPRHRAEDVPHRRADEPLDRFLLVRDSRAAFRSAAAACARATCRSCGRGGAARARARRRDASPATRSSRAASTRRLRGSSAGSDAASSTLGPPWQHGLRGAHRHDEVGVHERGVDAHVGVPRLPPGTSSRDSASCTSTVPRKRRASSGVTNCLDLAPVDPPREAAGDEQRHPLGRNACALELVDRHRDRRRTRLDRRRREPAAPAAR